MNDAFGVSTASAERSRVCMEEFCPAPANDPAAKIVLQNMKT
jgi:hypothetical protein